MCRSTVVTKRVGSIIIPGGTGSSSKIGQRRLAQGTRSHTGCTKTKEKEGIKQKEEGNEVKKRGKEKYGKNKGEKAA